MSKSNFRITSKGDFLKSLTMPNRVKKITVDFEEGGVYPWSMQVYKQLSDRIGVYVIEDTKGKIIYVGEAVSVGGLKERHSKHEKRELFRLFNASNLVVYYVTGADRDDAGKVALLERMLIYGNEPILNDDVKHSVPTAYFIADEMERQLSIIIDHYSKLQVLCPKDKEINRSLKTYNKLFAEITGLYKKTKTLDKRIKRLDECINKLQKEMKKREKKIIIKKKDIECVEKRIKKGENVDPKSVSRKKKNLEKKMDEFKKIQQLIKKLNLKLINKKSESSKVFRQLNHYTKEKHNIKPINDGLMLYNTIKVATHKMQNI